MAGQNGPAVSASIVVYGGAPDAVAAAKSLLAHTSLPLEVYLVDNASPDGALAKMRAAGLPENVHILPLGENRGYGAGHNAVLPLVCSKYHAVVNPDVLLSSDAIAAMAAYMDAHPDVAITTPRLLNTDGTEQHIAKRRPALLALVARQTGFPFLEKYNRHYLMLDEDLTKPTDVEFCSGSFFLMRTDVFKDIGGFDEGYFMYVEDADITQKALQKGRAVFLPGAAVTHAWRRAAHRDRRHFWWQVKSMARYFRKWGFRLK